MIYISLLVVLASMSACSGNSENVLYQNQDIQDVEQETVKVQLYYGCFCEFCVDFYTKDLYNTMMKLTSSIELLTYPFGNAHFTDAAHTKVECPGGEEECYGNKILACSIDQLKDQMKYVKYDSCVLKANSTDAAATKCGEEQRVDYRSILKCAKGPKGQELLIYYGNETYKVRPAQNYTPFILINGKESLGDFEKEVCKAFKHPPEACKH